MSISEKYPNICFEHFLAMFFIHQDSINIESINEQIGLYLAFESKDDFVELQDEINNIIKNKDLEVFVNYAKTHSPDITSEDLDLICNKILSHTF